jgi:hypothetical protein
MEVTGKSKTGEAGRKALIARAEARAAQLPPVVAEPQWRAEEGMAKSKNEGFPHRDYGHHGRTRSRVRIRLR